MELYYNRKKSLLDLIVVMIRIIVMTGFDLFLWYVCSMVSKGALVTGGFGMYCKYCIVSIVTTDIWLFDKKFKSNFGDLNF